MNYWIVPGLVRADVTEQDIINTVCRFYGITPEQLKAKTRKRRVVLPRQIACKLIRMKYPKMPLTAVGELLGGLDHATVLHSIKTVNILMETDKRMRAEFKQIKTNLNL